MDLVKAQFTFDGERFFEGEHDPSVRWNGFACPIFSRDVAVDVALYTAEGQGKAVFDDDTGEIRIDYWDEDCSIDDEFVLLDDGRYAVGGFSWAWQVKSEG